MTAIRTLCCLLAASLFFAACGGGQKQQETITISGAFALYPLAVKWAVLVKSKAALL